MGKDEIFRLLERRTQGKKDKEGNQVRLSVSQMLKCLGTSEKSVYRSIKNLEGIKFVVQRVTVIKKGKHSTFYEKKYWVPK